MRKLSVPVILLFLFVAGPAVTQAFAGDPPKGADVWKRCQGCHNVNGDGQTKAGKERGAPDMRDPKWQKAHSDADIEKAARNGVFEKGKMIMPPVGKKLSAAEMKAVTAHIRGFKKK